MTAPTVVDTPESMPGQTDGGASIPSFSAGRWISAPMVAALEYAWAAIRVWGRVTATPDTLTVWR